MEHLADLKLHQEELEAEKERLLHQEKRLDEEIQLLEEALKKQREEKKERLMTLLDQQQDFISLLIHKIEKHMEAYSLMCAEKTRRYNELMKEKQSLETEIIGMKLDARNGKL